MALRSWAQVEAFLDWCLVMVGIPSLHICPRPLTLTPVRGQIVIIWKTLQPLTQAWWIQDPGVGPAYCLGAKQRQSLY